MGTTGKDGFALSLCSLYALPALPFPPPDLVGSKSAGDFSLVFLSDNLCEHQSLVFGKEVIQPQVPLRLPCYDFTPVMNHTVVNAPLRLSYLLLVQPTPMV